MIIHANILEWAASYDGEPFHALLCDPPYHLTEIVKRFGKANAAPAQHGTDGAFQRVSKGFMGKTWDGGDVAYRPETWAALAQHLYPGAFGMAFSGSRGWHRMAVAIEDAGLIIHPTIFCWSYGSGFPKATRIDTQVDRKVGATRAKVGTRKHAPKFDAVAFGYSEKGNGYNSKSRESFDVTAPATDLAQAWQGHRYGLQALKPSIEPIIVFQRPYAGRPVDSITATGAGALNVDGGRVAAFDVNDGDPYLYRGDNGLAMSAASERLRTNGGGARNAAGRWPANFALVHHPACERVGVRRVKGTNTPGQRATGGSKPHHIYNGGWGGDVPNHYNAPDGHETIADWRCFKGWSGSVPCYETASAVFVPSASPAYLLDRLPILFRAVREHSTTDNSSLRDAPVFYRNENTRSAAGAYDAIVHALKLSEFPGFQLGCPSCRRSCDELLHRVLAACQDGLPSLLDALGVVHQALSEQAHNPSRPLCDLLTSCDADHLTGNGVGNRPSKTDDVAPSLSALRVQPRHTGDMEQREQPQSGQHGHIATNNIDEADTHEIPHHSACNTAAVLIFGLLSADLAWRFLLSEYIITRKEIYVNLPPCVVRRLGEQSGESESKRSQRGTVEIFDELYKRAPSWHGDSTERGHDDSGTAARFFHQSDWMAERLEEADTVGYFAKASRGEREAGLDPCQIALMRTEEEFSEATINDGRKKSIDNPYQRGETTRRNVHPTIKPLSLCKWLATLLLPPAMYAPRRILIPFAGVASEMIGARLAGWEEVVGVELEEEHIKIAQARLAYWEQMKYKITEASTEINVKISNKADDGQLEMF